MQLIRIPDHISDIIDIKLRQLQKLGCLLHPVTHQKFLRRFPDRVTENFTEITPVQTAESCDIFYRDIILEILFNKRECLFYIKIPQASILLQSHRGSRTGKIVQKQIQMSNQMKRRFV